MSNEDFEVHESGTGNRLNLVEGLKEKVERYEPYIRKLAADECSCASVDVKNIPCISCQARGLLE